MPNIETIKIVTIICFSHQVIIVYSV